MSKNLPAEIHIPEIDADFLLIPAGAFFVGGLKNKADAPRRLAAITKSFYMQDTPVTQKQYEIITGQNPSRSKNNLENPVEQVSWPEAVDFAEKLSRQTEFVLRLPTEMEWEYAARGGDGDKYTYAGSNDIDEVAWYRDNSGDRIQPVMQKKPNGYGLYDMTGNVWEWCSDAHSDYPNQELVDHRTPLVRHAPNRVYRGGSWSSTAGFARVAFRSRGIPDYRSGGLGFRLVLETI